MPPDDPPVLAGDEPSSLVDDAGAVVAVVADAGPIVAAAAAGPVVVEPGPLPVTL
jgi:hypothetical protein